MTLVQKRYEENQEFMRNYINHHQELKSFTGSFMEIQKANQKSRCTSLVISVGKTVKRGFYSYLTCRIKNPRVLFTHWGDDKKEYHRL